MNNKSRNHFIEGSQFIDPMRRERKWGEENEQRLDQA